MEKELAQSDLPVRRKFPKTTRKCHFYEKQYDINQRKNTSPFGNSNFSFFQPYLPLNVIFLITIIPAIAIKEFKSSPKGSRGNIFGLQISIHYQHHDDIQLKFVQCVICV